MHNLKKRLEKFHIWSFLLYKQHKDETMYTDEEHLELTDQVNITRHCKLLLKQERARLRKQDRKVTIAKLCCNIIIKALEDKQDDK